MSLMGKKIVDLRVYVVGEGGADYHDQSEDHWIVGQVSTPMSIYPEYKASRLSFGINILKTLIVEIEADDGTVGFGITTGGIPAAWIVKNHLKRFIIGQDVSNIELMWDQMYKGTIFYGRKGIVLNAISAVDLALWDLLGRLRQEPVYAMLGGKVRNELDFYATGPRPDLAKEMGFIGGKMALPYGPADSLPGLNKNREIAAKMRASCGKEFMLMWDCWMSLDLPYAEKLMKDAAEFDFYWLEECFNPDDYWSYKKLKARAAEGMLITGGEHEATRYGFRSLIENCELDIIQPDIGWCGGLTELIKIGNLADANSKMIIPHGSGPYSHHYVTTKTNSPFTEYIMMAPQADQVIPQYYPLLKNEPIPVNGKLVVPDLPGFGVELNRDEIVLTEYE